MRCIILFFLLLLVTLFKQLIAQSLLVGIPSADLAKPGHFEITHESQINFWHGNKLNWNSFNILCYGINKKTEITANLTNLSNEEFSNLTAGLGFKRIETINKKYEIKFTIGANVLFSLVNRGVGVWGYSHLSVRIPKLRTRLTGGANYATEQLFGFRKYVIGDQTEFKPIRKLTFLGGFEQPISRKVAIIADWIAGDHDLGAFMPAIQLFIRNHILILGYKVPNNPYKNKNAIIIEFMLHF